MPEKTEARGLRVGGFLFSGVGVVVEERGDVRQRLASPKWSGMGLRW